MLCFIHLLYKSSWLKLYHICHNSWKAKSGDIFLRHFPEGHSCAFNLWCQKNRFFWSHRSFPSLSSDLIMGRIILGMGGFVIFNCSRTSPNVIPFGFLHSLCNDSTLGFPITSPVVVTYSPVYMPAPVLGLHTRIPTRVPFEMVVSKIGDICPPATGFETTSLFFQTLISRWSPNIFSFPECFPKGL